MYIYPFVYALQKNRNNSGYFLSADGYKLTNSNKTD